MSTSQCHAEAAQFADWGPLSSLPGNPMMWLLILSELAVFGLFFLAFLGARLVHPEIFAAGQAHLDPVLGGVNTVVLISSGWLAAMAVAAGARNRLGQARLWMVASAAVGAVFIVVKVMEYAEKFRAGLGIETDVFFTLYYLLTGFHFLHVILGLGILLLVAWRNSPDNLETGAAFWHMVDLIWVVMYPLLYLVR